MDFGRQLADLMQGSEPAETPAPAKRIAKVIDPDRLRRLTGLAEAAATFGTGLAASVPAGLAGMAQMIPTRGRAPDVNKAAQTVEDVQSALTYLPRTPTGQRVLERGAGALEMLGAPAEYLGEKTLQYTGSPGAATAANVLLDPVNFIGMPGSGKAVMAAGRGAAAAPRMAGEMLQDLMMGQGRMEGQRGAIKMKGGNWLAGEVEGATKPLRKVLDDDKVYLAFLRKDREEGGGFAEWVREKNEQDPTYIRKDALSVANDYLSELGQPKLQGNPINRWIDTKLNRYIKNEMATPEDPVRKLAERGVSHMQGLDQHEGYVGIGTRTARKKAGLPEKGFGESLLARNWEAKADQAIHPRTAGELSDPNQWFAESAPSFEKQLEANPWLAKVSPETPVYESAATAENFDRMLGFDHLIDELKNAIDPNSDLPARLRLKPEDLEKVTMEQAVRRVHDINEYRAAKKAEANEVLARNPATFTFKEYPTVPGSDKPNEKGLAWKEIKQPGELPEGWIERGGNVAGPEGAVAIKGSVNDPRRKALEEALKYEGDVMGHCVGGYCDDVLSGRTQIYSLRDKKGEPHVTIEVSPGRSVKDETDWFTSQPENIQDEITAEALAKHQAGQSAADDRRTWGTALSEVIRSRMGEPPLEIIQIKGKGNKAPKAEYLPFVQDFVRGGNWSRVGDIQNTGLKRKGDFIDEFTPDQLDSVGKGEYVTQAEIENLRKSVKGKKAGGSVHISDNPDTMALALQAGGAIKAAAKAAERAAKAAKPNVLPAAEREANLARMLQESKTKTRLYHGTKAHDEYADEPGQAIRQFASSPTWLAKEPYTASGYSGGTGSTYPVYAQIKKPLVLGFDANDEAAKAFAAAKRLGVDVEYIKGMSAPEKAWEVINHPSFIDAVERAGYDGISIKEGGYRTFGVLDPRRIKSATGNRGTFDVTNPDITKKRGGKVSITDNLDTMRLAVQKRK